MEIKSLTSYMECQDDFRQTKKKKRINIHIIKSIPIKKTKITENFSERKFFIQ